MNLMCVLIEVYISGRPWPTAIRPKCKQNILVREAVFHVPPIAKDIWRRGQGLEALKEYERSSSDKAYIFPS